MAIEIFLMIFNGSISSLNQPLQEGYSFTPSYDRNSLIYYFQNKTFLIDLQFFQSLYSKFIQKSEKLFEMKNLPKKQKLKQIQVEGSDEQISQLPSQKQQNTHFFNKIIKKDSLFVTFSGMIESGVISNCQSLTMFYEIVAGPDWIKVSGQKAGVSQVAGSNGDKIVWNLPFQISFQTTYLSGWPQIYVILYGTDFFGRSFVQGYGNVHLPSSSGVQKRKIRVFKPLPQSIISGIFGYLGGVMAQYKDPKTVLTLGQGRQVTRVCTQGQINIKAQATKHNFKKFGYQ